ncbi:hypothetical protein AB0W27_00135 [Aliarcobacter butzleri]|uniref:hypothetical protein n=1 Tax=Aliarcobacter butzleri TaxID=28197 RepID=UPI00125EA9B0|nr:hypothetical protein [Aliarcobacter butzleri]MCG3686755.1 hypothetical protein [Aliarcobacter butzleri]MDN5089603.1 hypothetical protein [Aliarcobacter butzleri]UXC28793.1 hypothetical protein N3114_08925 [Aliarcobacter butzleri]
MNQTEYYEIKSLLLENRKKLEKLELLIPEKFEISYISDKTGLTRQAIRQRLLLKFEPKVDFWYEGAKIYLSQKVALQMLK